MTSFCFSPSAERDLEEIVDYIREHSGPSRAEHFLDGIEEAAMRLARMPRLGRTRRTLTDERVLFWPVLGYLRVYRHEVQPIEVVRVVSGRRDLRAVFRGQWRAAYRGWSE